MHQAAANHSILFHVFNIFSVIGHAFTISILRDWNILTIFSVVIIIKITGFKCYVYYAVTCHVFILALFLDAEPHCRWTMPRLSPPRAPPVELRTSNEIFLLVAKLKAYFNTGCTYVRTYIFVIFNAFLLLLHYIAFASRSYLSPPRARPVELRISNEMFLLLPKLKA
jgi:hypothetical protein